MAEHAHREFGAAGAHQARETEDLAAPQLEGRIGEGVDANAFDPETGLAFASSSDGTLTVARPDGADKLTVVQTLKTPVRSRTMTLDPKTHRLYVAAAEFLPPVKGPDGKMQRPQVVPGSFKIVVYER